MPNNVEANGVHLPSLSIRGFRGINRLDIERLGKVTLLAGNNSVGKTTVLDAVRLYAERGHVSAMHDVLLRHEEVEARPDDEERFEERPVFEALFSGRRPELTSAFTIGPMNDPSRFRVQIVPADKSDPRQLELFRRRGVSLDSPLLQIAFDDHVEYQTVFDDDYSPYPAAAKRNWRMRRSVRDPDWPENLACVFLGPGLPANRQTAMHWDEVALTPSEPLALEALKLACRLEISGVVVVARSRGALERRIVIGFPNGERVPLRSLGDGAARLFAVAVAFANAENGFLLIDETENGIHHSVQEQYWRLVFRAARLHNVQVLATTHSWDCVAGFAQAALDDKESEGVAVRLEVDDEAGEIRSVEYSEDDLGVAATEGIEIR